MADQNKRRLFLATIKKMGISIKVISKEFCIKELKKGKTKKYLVDDKISLTSKPGSSLCKNKEVTKIILRGNDICCPRGVVAFSFEEAKEKFRAKKLQFPIVVKPIDAAKGAGVTVGIKNFPQMKFAIEQVQTVDASHLWKLSGGVIIEEMVSGRDYRLLVLDGKCIAVAERRPAEVIGDGVQTIEELIESFNRTRPSSFIIKIDNEIKESLIKNKVELSTVLVAGKAIRLRLVANVSGGGQAYDYTNTVSPRFKKIAEKSANCLGLRLAGVDILTEDITSNNEKQKYWVLELNGAPQYEIHEKPIINGRGVKVTEKIINSYLRK